MFKDGTEWELFFDARSGLLRKRKEPSFYLFNNEISRGPDTWNLLLRLPAGTGHPLSIPLGSGH